LLEKIVDHHHKDNSATNINKKWIQHGSNRTLKKNTLRWKLKVHWEDQSTSWEPLCNLKETNLIKVAQYALAYNVHDEMAFAWWVPSVLKLQKHMTRSLSAILTIKCSQKYGIKVPPNIKRALEIDQEMKTDYWEKAIAKEMLHVTLAFQILENRESPPIRSKWIPCHMGVNVKVDFTCKAHFAAGGHMTEPPTAITYSGVVARDSIRLAFLIAALNDLYILTADIFNAYLNAYTKKKVHTTCGIEFGPHAQGQVAIIRP